MRKNLRFMLLIGAFALTLAACGEKSNPEEKSTVKTESSLSTTQKEEKSSKDKEGQGESSKYVLDKKSAVGPYSFYYPSADTKKDGAHGKYFGGSTGYVIYASAPKYYMDNKDEYDTSTIDAFVETSKTHILVDVKKFRRDIFGVSFDVKPYLTAKSTVKTDIKNFDAYFVHGVIGDETSGAEIYFVGCYVMDEKAPFYVFGIPDGVANGAEEDLEEYLKAIVETFEWND